MVTNSASISTSAATILAIGCGLASGARGSATAARDAKRPVRERRDEVVVVRREERRAPAVAVCRDECDEPGVGAAVLAERRLVQHEERRRRGQRGRHRETALLAAREREWIRGGEAGEPEALEQVHRDPSRVRRVAPRAQRSDHELVLHAARHELVFRILKDGADPRDESTRGQ
jgi:hypothetical protein